MIRRAFIASVVIAFAAAASVSAGESRHFGAPFGDTRTVVLADALAKPETFKDAAVRLEGTITDVCQKEGCWLVITDGTRSMRIHMKGHAFAVPKDISGRKVVVEGMVEVKTIPEAMARHLAEESKSGPDPATIKGDQTIVRMMATGVELVD